MLATNQLTGRWQGRWQGRSSEVTLPERGSKNNFSSNHQCLALLRARSHVVSVPLRDSWLLAACSIAQPTPTTPSQRERWLQKEMRRACPRRRHCLPRMSMAALALRTITLAAPTGCSA